MSVKSAQSAWQDLPSNATPINAERLNYERTRTQEVVEQVELTQRVTTPIMGAGFNESGAGSVTDAIARTIVALPFTTTRWRLRFRNIAACPGGRGTIDEPGVSVIKFAKTYVGPPKMPTTGRWAGAFASAPSLALEPFESETIASKKDATSAWAESPALQFQAGVPTAISVGWTADGANRIFYDLWGSLYLGAAGASAKTGETAAPGGLEQLMPLSDLRLEYEFVTPKANPGRIMMAIGDSLTAGKFQNREPGKEAGADGGCYPFETWPAAMGLNREWAYSCLGADGSRTADWIEFTSWWWERCLPTGATTPNVAVVFLGTNDIANSVSAAAIQTNLASIVNHLQGLGIPEVWLATIIGRAFAGGKETIRLEVNEFIRSMPAGITRVLDFDQQTVKQAEANKFQAIYNPNLAEGNPHMLRGGYQRLGSTA